MLGDLDFFQAASASKKSNLPQSALASVDNPHQADFGEFAFASGENSFGDFTPAENKPAEADDFGDFFASPPPPKSTSLNDALGEMNSFGITDISTKAPTIANVDSGLNYFSSPAKSQGLENIANYSKNTPKALPGIIFFLRISIVQNINTMFSHIWKAQSFKEKVNYFVNHILQFCRLVLP